MKAIEFFCGAGGTAAGLKRAGFKCILAADISPSAVRTCKTNVGGQVREFDVRKAFHVLGDIVDYAKPQIIIGSPPCQEFSTAGKRLEAGPDNYLGSNALLTRTFAMLIALGRPEWVLMENVPEVAKSRVWKRARETLKQQGYGLTEKILIASSYGAPQNRKRLVIVGRLGERDGFLSSALTDAASAKPMPVRAILRPEIPEDRALLDVGHFYVRPYTGGRGVRSIDEPCPTVIRTTREGPGPKYLGNPHPKDPIPAKEAHVFTQDQLSRIQGFPLGWDWSAMGSDRRIDQAIANAVPPSLAEAIGRVILARHRGETIPAVEDGFGEWLCRQGKAVSAARNVKANVNRARKLLGGRTYADRALEVGRLEEAAGFDGLPTQTKSDLRASLRLYADCQDAKTANFTAA